MLLDDAEADGMVVWAATVAAFAAGLLLAAVMVAGLAVVAVTGWCRRRA